MYTIWITTTKVQLYQGMAMYTHFAKHVGSLKKYKKCTYGMKLNSVSMQKLINKYSKQPNLKKTTHTHTKTMVPLTLNLIPIFKWILILWYIYIVEYYSEIKEDEVLTHMIWMNLKIWITKSDKIIYVIYDSFTEKDKISKLVYSIRKQTSGYLVWVMQDTCKLSRW